MTSPSPRITLIHATPIAMEPIHAAFAALWPQAEAVDVLEAGLAIDRAKTPELSEDLSERVVDLARYAVRMKSAGVLFTCSAFGAAIERAAALLDIPVLKPNAAMFEAALQGGHRIAMLYTFPPSKDGMEAEFHEAAHERGSDATLHSVFVPGAIEAIRAGDAATHNRLIAEAAGKLHGFDAIILAHFSMARALEAVTAATHIPVWTSPEAAVRKLKRLLG